MLFSMRAFIKQMLKSPIPTHLGRWEHRQPDKHIDLKQTWANTDNCGDILCGNPYQLRKKVELIIDKEKKGTK